MAIKEELLGMLREAINFEERTIPLLHDKCLACFREIKQSEMIEDDKNRMRYLLNELISDAREHLLELEELAQKVKESPQHEF